MASTAAQRQAAKTSREKSLGLKRTSVRTHEANHKALRANETALENPDNGSQLRSALSELKVVAPNVSKVQHISPFRYPGGKTWLVPTVKAWLHAMDKKPDLFIEPFAGGASVGLTVAFNGLAEKVLLTELDDAVAAVWKALILAKDADYKALCNAVLTFEMTEESVLEVLNKSNQSLPEQAFSTIVANRAKRGGILAVGVGLMKNGEGGKGIASRWYPATLVKRFEMIRSMRSRLMFEQRDAFELFDEHNHNSGHCWFVDPPYTAGGKNAGARLYNLHSLDHDKLFKCMSEASGAVMATYDAAPEVLELAGRWGFAIHDARMRNTHNELMDEVILLKPDFTFA